MTKKKQRQEATEKKEGWLKVAILQMMVISRKRQKLEQCFIRGLKEVIAKELGKTVLKDNQLRKIKEHPF